jgi:hypothetical protein
MKPLSRRSVIAGMGKLVTVLPAVGLAARIRQLTNLDQPTNPYPDPLLADDVTGTDAYAKWSAWQRAHGLPS